MSYDLIFVPRADDQSWDEALAAAEEAVAAAEESDNEDPPSAQVWARLLAGAGQVLGDLSVFESADHYELDHEPTGIQLSYYAQEVGVTVPYWYRGAEARAVVEQLYQLGVVVEAETGLRGYDPQLELPLAEAAARPDQAVSCFDQVAASFAQRGISSPSGG